MITWWNYELEIQNECNSQNIINSRQKNRIELEYDLFEFYMALLALY